MKKAVKYGLFLPVFLLVVMSLGIPTNADDTYYSSLTNTESGQTLASELHSITSNTHTNQLTYDGLWDAYYTTDVLPGVGIIWDIYSDCIFRVGTDQDKGNHSEEGERYNREHTVPQSWFNKKSPMVADAHHIFATDAVVNGKRSNYPFGEVSSASYTSNNGGKLGNSSFSGYSGTVFEPIDEYKGDIARAYMYMAIRYSNVLGSWSNGSDVVFTSSYPYLTDYAKNIFTKWAHEDPVSDKEYIRNEAIYEIQHNRNPFIDHPEYADVIWPNNYSDSVTNTAYNKTDVINSINQLTSSSTDNLVYLTYEKYCRLNTSDKGLVTNASNLFSIVESKSNTNVDLDIYWEGIISRGGSLTVDTDKVKSVISLINTLPDTITLENEELVNQVNSSYLTLNSLEKAEVTNYSKLSNALLTIDTIKNTEKINEVISLINTLPDSITLENEELVNQIKAKYDALSSISKSQVTNYSKLESAINTIEALSVKTFELVTDDSTLNVNDEIIIVATSYNKAIGGAVSNYYRAGVDVTVDDAEIIISKSNSTNVFTLTTGEASGSFGLYNGTEYLSASSSYANLVGKNELDSLASWTISIDSNANSTITSTGNTTNNIIIYDNGHSDFTSKNTIPSYGKVKIYKNINSNNSNVEKTAYEKFEALSTKSSMKFNYSKTVEESEGISGYSLLTSVDGLVDGAEIIITNNASNNAFGTLSNNVGQTVSVLATDNTITNISNALVFTVVVNSDSTISLMNNNKYLSSTSAKKVSFVNSIGDSAKWTFVYTNGSFTVTNVGNTSLILQYNNSSPRFTTYTSAQQSIKIYKANGKSSQTSYSYSNVALRYGAFMDLSLYDELLESGNDVSFGVALSLDNTNFANYLCTPARVDYAGAKDISENGNYYQYSVIFNVPESKYETKVYAKAYVTIDGTTYYMKSASYSIKDLASYYITNANALSLCEEALAALGGF